MELQQSFLEVDGTQVRVFLGADGVITAYILPDSRVEHWKSRMTELKRERGERIVTEEDIARLRELGKEND